MDTIQNRVAELIHKGIQSRRTIALYIRNRLTLQGIYISDEEFETMKQIIENVSTDDDAISIPILSVELTSFQLDLGNDIDFEKFVLNLYKDVITAITSEIPDIASSHLYDDLIAGSAVTLKRHRKKRRRFESLVQNDWGDAIDALEAFILTATRVGDYLAEDYGMKAEETNDTVFFCLTRLHARGCQIAQEILTLLKAGFADGALARWRALHETAVAALFIKKHGKETAERFLNYNVIEAFKSLDGYINNCHALGLRDLSSEELTKIKADKDELIERFGQCYESGNYGWASHALNKKKVDYKDIEDSVELSYLTPYYKLASANIHASPRGLYFPIGIDDPNLDLLHTGPSIDGLALPGQLTAATLLQISVEFLGLDLTIDHLIWMKTLVTLENTVHIAFS